MRAHFKRIQDFLSLLSALYRLSSVIKLDTQGGFLRLDVSQDVMVSVDGHLIRYASGHVINKGMFMSDQPGITAADLTTPQNVVAETVMQLLEECRRCNEPVPPVITAWLEKQHAVASQ